MKKKIISLFACVLALMLTICIPGVSAETPSDNESSTAGSGFTVIEQNDRFELSLNVDTTNFAVTDKNDGKVWYAFPTDVEDNESYSKTVRKSLQSIVNVSYYNEDGNLVNVSSYSHSVEQGTFIIKKIKKGFELLFSFSMDKENLTIPVDVVISESTISASIPYNKIKEEGSTEICDIELLPNFGCGRVTDDGYALIPDGSGAIINFKDAGMHESNYSQQVYGKDMSQDLLLYDTDNMENVRMPIYGMKNGNSAFLAVIESGQTSASIMAQTLSGFTECYASFIRRDSDLTGIQSKEQGRRIVTLTSEKAINVSPKVEYYFLNGENANYSGMASVYRNYLIKKYKLKKMTQKSDTALNIETFGGVKELHSFAGITYSRVKKATTLSEVIEMQKDFDSLGSNVKWSLYGFTKGGYAANTVDSVKFQSGLGSKKQLQTLSNAVGKQNIYVGLNFIQMYDHSWQSFKNGKLVKSLNGLLVERHFSLLSNGTQNTDFGYWNYYNHDTVEKYSEHAIKKSDGSYGILYMEMGDQSYSDFRDKAFSPRKDIIDTYQKILKDSTKKGIATSVEGGNDYALSGATFFSEVPVKSSDFDIESYEVPFYSMVLRGLIPMTTEPLNSDSASNETFLKAMESGIGVSYRLTGCNPNELKNTKLNFLYNTKYTSKLKDSLLKQAKEIENWQKMIVGQAIISHQTNGVLSVTVFENGKTIAVNYSKNQVEYNGHKINANSYFIV